MKKNIMAMSMLIKPSVGPSLSNSAIKSSTPLTTDLINKARENHRNDSLQYIMPTYAPKD